MTVASVAQHHVRVPRPRRCSSRTARPCRLTPRRHRPMRSRTGTGSRRTTLVAFPAPAGGAPPALQISMAMTQGAVYDAVNAIEPRHQPYLLAPGFDPTASKDAAAATAAYRVLANIVSTVPATSSSRTGRPCCRRSTTAYAARSRPIPDGPVQTAGIAAGNAAAEAMIAARQGDGRFGPSPWVSNTDLGHWQPLLNPDGTQMLDPTPWVAGVRPFLIESSSQFRTDGPKRSPVTRRRRTSTRSRRSARWTARSRTPEQTHIAIFWQSAGGPALLWNASRPQTWSMIRSYGVDLDDSALLFAKLNLAGADAAHQLLERQVLLGLLAAVAGDPRGGQRRQSRDRARRVVDGAHHRAVPRAPVGAPVPRRRAPARAADVLRHGQIPFGVTSTFASPR